MLNEAKVGGFTVAGQPTEDELQALKQSGCSLVLNVRMPDEPGQVDGQTIESCGLSYASVPFTGPTLTAEHVRKIREAVDAAGGSVLIH
jgi:protein tyrosine phosphatase (PTP) superfamily phosphohydrolase (DUF442 family)